MEGSIVEPRQVISQNCTGAHTLPECEFDLSSSPCSAASNMYAGVKCDSSCKYAICSHSSTSWLFLRLIWQLNQFVAAVHILTYIDRVKVAYDDELMNVHSVACSVALQDGTVRLWC